ncbi:hypothetical protein L2W58_04745 [Dethiosulfovibrio sp. F2B]|uniref:Uncharacterized protein n=1 Tax=Dethiosulfovibrio peptidovorans DSM 11002 TaxID=469381 RepID=D2Z5U7_9BACT|nr:MULTISPECIES: hypothetical protein [Dethiosulfovibrio]EFC90844.1 hypothetical protein Dpep_0818 [Dethiosulfovibrio peptidovorans DSM 11002]MCF4151103.1 hypothetical protein [Dethiosulfovibrio faecalis]
MYAKIDELDMVKLRDGTEGTVVHVGSGGSFYTVEVESSDGDWELFDVLIDKIESVIWKNPDSDVPLHGTSLKYALSDTSFSLKGTLVDGCDQIALAS